MEYACRSCGSAVRLSFCDLGATPFSNAFLSVEELDQPETFYPLHARVCERCWLVQLPAFEPPDRIFNDQYAYFSSYSDVWLRHAEEFCTAALSENNLGRDSLVIEVASNDGYLLQYFVRAGVPVLGVEPAGNCAAVARSRGIPTLEQFFGARTAELIRSQGRAADLLVANNVIAHVPDVNDFVAGLKLALAPGGLISLEFPHLLRLMQGNQFDTIYHEHFSYLSLMALSQLLERHGLAVVDVRELGTHGGSLRVMARHENERTGAVDSRVADILAEERAAGLDGRDAYRGFQEQVVRTRNALLRFLLDARAAKKRVWAYGAPAKGNTLLNYCGVRTDLLEATVDRSPHKQGRYLPGVRIPVLPPESLIAARPDFVLILPWNLAPEITGQLDVVRSWGGRFVVPIPEPMVLP
jgi:SAM-dependent methyltransferase